MIAKLWGQWNFTESSFTARQQNKMLHFHFQRATTTLALCFLRMADFHLVQLYTLQCRAMDTLNTCYTADSTSQPGFWWSQGILLVVLVRCDFAKIDISTSTMFYFSSSLKCVSFSFQSNINSRLVRLWQHLDNFPWMFSLFLNFSMLFSIFIYCSMSSFLCGNLYMMKGRQFDQYIWFSQIANTNF